MAFGAPVFCNGFVVPIGDVLYDLPVQLNIVAQVKGPDASVRVQGLGQPFQHRSSVNGTKRIGGNACQHKPSWSSP